MKMVEFSFVNVYMADCFVDWERVCLQNAILIGGFEVMCK